MTSLGTRYPARTSCGPARPLMDRASGATSGQMTSVAIGPVTPPLGPSASSPPPIFLPQGRLAPRGGAGFLAPRRCPPVPGTRRSQRTVRWSPPLGSPERAHLPERGAVPLIPSLRREEDPLLAP